MATWIWISFEHLCQTGKQPALYVTNSLPQPLNLIQELLDSDWPTFVVEWVVQKSNCFHVRTSESLRIKASGLCCPILLIFIVHVWSTQYLWLSMYSTSHEKEKVCVLHCAILSLPLHPLDFANVEYRWDVFWEKKKLF